MQNNAYAPSSLGSNSTGGSVLRQEGDVFKLKIPVNSKILIEVTDDRPCPKENGSTNARMSNLQTESLYNLESLLSHRQTPSRGDITCSTPRRTLDGPSFPLNTTYRLSYLPPK